MRYGNNVIVTGIAQMPTAGPLPNYAVAIPDFIGSASAH